MVPSACAAPLLASPHTGLCFLDSDGDGLRSLREPLYLQIGSCQGGARAADVRLSDGGFPGGTIVNGNDDDTGRAHVAASAPGYAFVDTDGSSTLSGQDPIFLHFGPLPGALAPGDVPLTGNAAFQPLTGHDPSVGTPLGATAMAVGAESYAEADGTPGFTIGDVLFLDFDGDGFSSVGDLRLALGTAPETGTTRFPTTDPLSPASTAPAPPSTLRDTTPTTSGRSSTTDRGAPVLPSGVILAGLVGAALRRRKLDL